MPICWSWMLCHRWYPAPCQASQEWSQSWHAWWKYFQPQICQSQCPRSWKCYMDVDCKIALSLFTAHISMVFFNWNLIYAQSNILSIGKLVIWILFILKNFFWNSFCIIYLESCIYLFCNNAIFLESNNSSNFIIIWDIFANSSHKWHIDIFAWILL